MKLDLKTKYFIAGFLTPVVIVPLIDYAMNIIGALQEVEVLKLSKIGTKLQKECREILEDEKEEEIHTCAIGFQPPEDYNYDEDDDLDDD